MKRFFLSILPLVILVALPICLRKPAETLTDVDDQLVIISPHNESIRYEFEQAFRAYYREMTGRTIAIDWRAPGGTGDAVRYVQGAYTANFKDLWQRQNLREWTLEIEQGFMNPNTKPNETADEARKAFLNSDCGIGIDVFFGGGQYELSRLAKAGLLVPTGLANPQSQLYRGNPNGILYKALGEEQRRVLYPPVSKQPLPPLYSELFGEHPQIDMKGAGETWHDVNDCYYGTCFSSFGICQNLDRLAAAGYPPNGTDDIPLKQWRDLGDPRLFHQIGIADPTKSGSLNKCFEMIIQSIMQQHYAELSTPIKNGTLTEQEALNKCWNDAMTLIKKIGGNCIYLTFSASKIPMDVATGQVAAGMSIDFYGQSQAEWANHYANRRIMVYHTPFGESTVSVDPVGIFRGAPNREAANLFLRFLFTRRGQLLWNQRKGTPNGPVKYNLHRLPVRKDCYADDVKPLLLSPDAAPYQQAASFTYKANWTAAYFNLIRRIVKIMVIDCQDELQTAWKAILDAGGPDAVPDAYAAFQAMPFSYQQAPEIAGILRGPMQGRTALEREWTLFFQKHYRLAETLAKQH